MNLKMGTVQSSYSHGLDIPSHTENQWSSWSSWSVEEPWSNWFSSYNPWDAATYQENKNKENTQNHQLFHNSDFTSATGCLGTMQSKSGGFVTDQSMIFQNITNENRLKNLQNFRASRQSTSNKRNRKKRKSNRGTRAVNHFTIDTTQDSCQRLQLQEAHQGWNHEPVFDWLQTRFLKTNYQNSSRLRSFGETDKNPYRLQNVTIRNQSSVNTSTNSSETAVSESNLKSCNLSKNYSVTSGIRNVSSRKVPVLNHRNESTTTRKKRNFQKSVRMKSQEILNSENSAEDVIYLYSVDPSSSQDKIVLEIDLESDGVHMIPNKSSKGVVGLNNKPKSGTAAENKSVIIVDEPVSKVPVKSKKRKLYCNDNRSNKRSNYMPRCTACDMLYDEVIGKSGNMYISSSCSHAFCDFCISKSGKLKVCPACKIKFLSFRRLYL